MFIVVCRTGSSKPLSTSASRKAEEAFKTGRLVVTGQLLEMLSKTQRPRPTASISGVDKTRMGPLSLKVHNVSLKESNASGISQPKKQPTANVPKLQSETATLDRAEEKAQLEYSGEIKAATSASVTNAASTDPFCPVIASTVSLYDKQ